MTEIVSHSGAGSRFVQFHPLVIRVSDDDAETYVVGRVDIGEFVEVPATGVEAIRQLSDGDSLREVEERLTQEKGVEVDLANFVKALAEVGFVKMIDGEILPDRYPRRQSHLRWLSEWHVSWLFGPPAKLAYAALVVVTVFTVTARPHLVPTFRDFYWSDYVGLVVLTNTAMFSVTATMHELSHLVAARSLGAPSSISLSTRLHYLVLQTDVTAVWAVPRRKRYRVYVSGLLWDLGVICVAILAIAYAAPTRVVEGLLKALVVTVIMAMALQAHVYMRTDLYFVLVDMLRCGNLFQQGLAYARFVAGRVVDLVLRRPSRSSRDDPTFCLTARERRAVRLYAIAVVAGGTVALTNFALFGLPIVLYGIAGAVSAVIAGLDGGSLVSAADGAMLILVEGGLQGVFLVTLYRQRRKGLPWDLSGPRRLAKGFRGTVERTQP